MKRIPAIIALIAIMWLSLFGVHPPPVQAQFAATAAMVPTKIKPTEGYQVIDLIWGALPYSGNLDYQLRLCNLTFTSCSLTSGAWSYPASSGVVTVPPPPTNQPFGTGVYIVRFKPAGSSASVPSNWTNWMALLIDSFDTYYGPSHSSSAPTIGVPVRGSTSVFSKAGATNAFTAVTIESNDCPLTANMPAGMQNPRNQRITKSTETTYWNLPKPNQFRWCIGDVPVPAQGTPLYYTFSPVYMESWNTTNNDLMANVANNAITVINPDTNSRVPGILGSFKLDPSATTATTSIANSISIQKDMREHYALLPRNRKYPVLSGSARQVVHELTFGWDPRPEAYGSGLINLWHSEALAPTVAGAVVRMRYIERGISFDDPTTPVVEPSIVRWSVVEDWEWGADGSVQKITQWGLGSPSAIPGMCWRPSGYNPAAPGTSSDACISGLTPTAVLHLLEYTAPSGTGPLTAHLRDPIGGDYGTTIDIAANGDYQLEVFWPDGKPYSGFLEVKLGNLTPSLWRDKNSRPIYVHRGKVRVGPAAYGSLSNTTLQFSVRPYLTNSSLDSLIAGTTPIANGIGTYNSSSLLTLIVGP